MFLNINKKKQDMSHNRGNKRRVEIRADTLVTQIAEESDELGGFLLRFDTFYRIIATS